MWFDEPAPPAAGTSKVLHALDGQRFQAACRRDRVSGYRTTRIASRVTCKRCLRLMESDRVGEAARVGLLVRGFVPDDFDEREFHSMRSTVPTSALDEQKVWIARWGTQTALVWAVDEQWAEARVRRRGWDRRMARHRLIGMAQQLDGPVSIRLATAADLAMWEEAGGKPVKGVAAAV